MKRLLAVSILVLALPFVASMVHSSPKAQAFNSVAVAGHVKVGGGYCTCGDVDCILDPGECDGGVPTAHPAGDAGGVMLAAFALGLALRFLLKL